MIRDSV